MPSILIHNPHCSKSRSAKALLEFRGIQFTVLDYMQGQLSHELLSELPMILQLDYPAFIRAGEEIYKELALAGKQLDRGEWIEVLKQHPSLLERPIFLHHGKGIIARPPERVIELLD